MKRCYLTTAQKYSTTINTYSSTFISPLFFFFSQVPFSCCNVNCYNVTTIYTFIMYSRIRFILYKLRAVICSLQICVWIMIVVLLLVRVDVDCWAKMMSFVIAGSKSSVSWNIWAKQGSNKEGKKVEQISFGYKKKD